MIYKLIKIIMNTQQKAVFLNIKEDNTAENAHLVFNIDFKKLTVNIGAKRQQYEVDKNLSTSKKWNLYFIYWSHIFTILERDGEIDFLTGEILPVTRQLIVNQLSFDYKDDLKKNIIK